MDISFTKSITIFICIEWFLPAYKAGGPVQSIANMVTQLQDDNIHFKIFCSDHDVDKKVLNEIKTDEWIDFNNNTKVWYASKKSRNIWALKTEIGKSNVDILFINGIYSWLFNLVPLLFCKARRKIISVRGMLHPGALSQKKNKKKLFLYFWKITGLNNRYEFHASTAEEKECIIKIFSPNKKIFIAPNFPRVFSPVSPAKNEDKLKLISVALISPMKNHLLILKALKKSSCNISYNIYGAIKDVAYWKECIAEIESMPPNISVHFNGDIVPGEVEKFLQQHHVFILPSKSENFGHAIYEAFSAGKPVITSTFTPWNNLRSQNAGINVDIDDIETITGAINFFAKMNQQDFTIWSKGAVTFSDHAVNINTIKAEYRQMFFMNES